MKTIYSDDHRGHTGAKEFHLGEMVPMFEMPRRIDMILARMAAVGMNDIVAPEIFGDEAILAIHARDYVTFLSQAWDLWKRESAQDYALPFTFIAPSMRKVEPSSVHGKLGRYAFDLAVPFVVGTWRAARSAAEVALTGQKLVAGGARSAFALCRPPGHHALSDMGGGYCYLNNAAIAAQAFCDQGATRVAILDVDYHHGNGSQSIFYGRPDVLFVSLHGDPMSEFPYYLGYGDETGAGAGEGCNLNLPLPPGTAWPTYGEALQAGQAGLARIRDFGPDALVVSLGVDTFKDDPISAFKLENDDYLKIGEAIAGLGRPTLFVMEGGYAVEDIGVNTVNVLTGFESAA
jgi:acetoin utilization deacetylase AcuC-like enzyme